MSNCKLCGSRAINPGLHGRGDGSDLDLCDVCYWRACAERLHAYEDAGLTLEECAELAKGLRDERLMVLPCKQFQTVYYILDDRVYIGWYLARAGKNISVIVQAKIERNVWRAADDTWFLTRKEAEAALKRKK